MEFLGWQLFLILTYRVLFTKEPAQDVELEVQNILLLCHDLLKQYEKGE